MLKIHVKKLPHFSGLELPKYETPDSAGMDLRCATQQSHILNPGQRWAAPTGLCIAIPRGYEAQIRPRSGLALRQGLTLINSPGTIDSDYRGEIKVALVNLSSEIVEVERGMRIAQLVVAPVVQAELVAMDDLEVTQRGSGGFGHTGAF